ncbi:MAG: phosphoribosylanthranilate isomerase [Candidatus Eremiobacteraeota bacterium]|nr:phosphoribosylanthranilate isomerase [Candidatus Eremiobacteraeota bacterium]
MTSLADVILAVETGADAIGMIFAPSVRRIAQSAAKHIAENLPPFITPVGVFVNPTREEIDRVREIFPDLVVQLHGEETPSFVSSLDGKIIKAIHVPHDASDPAAIERAANLHPRAIVMFDTSTNGTSGGTGVAFPWKVILPASRNRQVIVAGGLTPETVGACVRTVHPYGVDVRSGVETEGRKDAKKMRAFVKAVRDADAAT